MKTLIIILFIVISNASFSQSVPIMNYDQLETRLSHKSDTVYLLNFWATWCKPCVEELPDFIKLNNELKDKKFKLILVSLDFTNHIEKRVKPFIIDNNINCEIIVLDDPDANTWINKVDESWDGAIPVSLIINNNEREFYNGTLNYDDLKRIIIPKLKN